MQLIKEHRGWNLVLCPDPHVCSPVSAVAGHETKCSLNMSLTCTYVYICRRR